MTVRTTPDSTAPLPLSGIRVISVEQFGAGPWGTMFLADLGAEIIKVENPKTGGDVARTVNPYAIEQDSIYFHAFNRNKLGVTLNLRHPRGRTLLRELVAISDAVFNNLRGDQPAKLGLDYPTLSAVKQSIVCCSLTGFGRTGPRASEPGYDYLMQGYAGWMSITGEPGSPPTKSGLSLVDLSAGVMAALGTLSAIFAARTTGKGRDVDVNLFDAALSQLGYLAAWHLSKGYQPQRWADSSHPSQIPSQVLPTKDGWLVVMCAKEKFYQNLVRLLGAPELGSDPRFSSFAARLENRKALSVELKALTRKFTTTECLDRLRGAVPCAPVNSVEAAFQDPQALHDEMILELPHPELGTVRTAGAPIKLSDARPVHHRGPKLGEHNTLVYGQYLGYSECTLAELRAAGVI